MNMFKRFLAWAVIVISIIGILVCALGTVGSWMINDGLTDGILKLLSVAQAPLSSVEDALTLAGTKLHTANSAVETVRDATTKLGDRIEKNSPILDLISLTLKEVLGPTVKDVREKFLPVRELVLTINSTLEALNALPRVELPTLTPKLQAVTERVNEANDAVEQLQTNVSDIRSGMVENRVQPFMDKVDALSNFLTTLEQDVKTYIEQVNKLQADLTSLQAKIPSIINMITILISIMFVWVILAQLSLILIGRLYLKTGKMVWAINPQEQPAAQPVLDTPNQPVE